MDQIVKVVAPILAQLAVTYAGTVVGQVLHVIAMLLDAWPAIQQGAKSEEPYIDALKQVIGNGGKPLPDTTFDLITTGLKSQIAIEDAQVAADAAAIADEAK